MPQRQIFVPMSCVCVYVCVCMCVCVYVCLCVCVRMRPGETEFKISHEGTFLPQKFKVDVQVMAKRV